MSLHLHRRRDEGDPGLNRGAYFTGEETVRAMEAEHRPLWAAFLRAIALSAPGSIAAGMRVMEFGCNRGGLLAVLAGGHDGMWPATPPSRALGIDVDTPAMRALLADAARASRGVLFSSASPASFPEQFDLVLSHEVVYLLPDPGRTFAELHAALVPGGHAAITTGCHRENPLYAAWRRVLEREGVKAMDRAEDEYESALRRAGFGEIRRARLVLAPSEYDGWVAARPSREPNADWFPDAAEERRYYTGFGKPVFIARKGDHP